MYSQIVELQCECLCEIFPKKSGFCETTLEVWDWQTDTTVFKTNNPQRLAAETGNAAQYFVIT